MLNIDPGQKTLVAVCSVLVIAGSLGTVILYFTRGDADVGAMAKKLHHVVGEVAAEETARLLGRPGRVVVVSMDTQMSPTRPAEAELESFVAAAKKHGPLTIVATPTVVPESSLVRRESGLTGRQFLDLLRQYPDVDAIVSLAGAPGLTDEQWQALPKKMPKVVVVMALTFRAELKPLFEENVVQVAITPRFNGPPAGARAPESPREWFDYSFQVVTPATAASLPE